MSAGLRYDRWKMVFLEQREEGLAVWENPLIPLRIFRSRNVSGANAIQALVVAGMFATFFLGALYLELLGYGPLQIGLAFLPTTLVMGTLSLHDAPHINWESLKLAVRLEPHPLK